MSIGTAKIENLKELRAQAKMTLQQLAAKSGLSVGTLTNAQQGKVLTKASVEAILQALGQNGSVAPELRPIHLKMGISPVTSDAEDPLVTAFKLLLEELDKRIDERVRRGAAQIAVAPTERFPTGPLHVPSVPESDVVLSQPVAISAGFPVTSAINNWRIRYEKKFLKEFEVSGLTGPIRASLVKFASLGETYSGLGFTKLERSMVRERTTQFGGASYEFRVNRRWRVLVRKDTGDKAYTITRLIHHDEIE